MRAPTRMPTGDRIHSGREAPKFDASSHAATWPQRPHHLLVCFPAVSGPGEAQLDMLRIRLVDDLGIGSWSVRVGMSRAGPSAYRIRRKSADAS